MAGLYRPKKAGSLTDNEEKPIIIIEEKDFKDEHQNSNDIVEGRTNRVIYDLWFTNEKRHTKNQRRQGNNINIFMRNWNSKVGARGVDSIAS